MSWPDQQGECHTSESVSSVSSYLIEDTRVSLGGDLGISNAAPGPTHTCSLTVCWSHTHKQRLNATQQLRHPCFTQIHLLLLLLLLLAVYCSAE